MVTRKPLACNNLASDAEIIPLPNDDVTPPVTNIYLAINCTFKPANDGFFKKLKNKIPLLYKNAVGKSFCKIGVTYNRGGHANLRQFFNCKKSGLPK